MSLKSSQRLNFSSSTEPVIEARASNRNELDQNASPLSLNLVEICFDHFSHQLVKGAGRPPTQLSLNLFGTTHELGGLGRAIKGIVILDEFAPREIDNGKSGFDKITHRKRFARRHHVIVRLLRPAALATSPGHNLELVPNPAGFPDYQEQARFACPSDSGDSARDLAGHEIFPATWRLVVVKDSVTNKEAGGLPIDARQLRGKGFCAAIWARWSHRGVLILGELRCGPEDF